MSKKKHFSIEGQITLDEFVSNQKNKNIESSIDSSRNIESKYIEGSNYVTDPMLEERMLDEWDKGNVGDSCSIEKVLDDLNVDKEEYFGKRNQEQEVVIDKGVCVELGDRALFLAGSLSEYLKKSRLKGYKTAIDKGYANRPSDSYVKSMKPRGEIYEATSRSSFMNAYGYSQMIEADVDVDCDEISRDFRSFTKKYSGSGNKDKRELFRGTLNKQEKDYKDNLLELERERLAKLAKKINPSN